MPFISTVLESLAAGKADPLLLRLYGSKPGVLKKQVQRYVQAIQAFQALYPDQTDIELFSSPGRTEVGGNHTDHNGGRILAAAIDLDIVAVVAKNDSNIVQIKSAGYSHDTVSLDHLFPVESEKYTSAGLIRGVCARMRSLGFQAGGFNAYATSSVPNGSGLSSSAAFEVLVAVIENALFNNAALEEVQLAQISQYSENNFFGKPCGLMDQTTCAVGGFVTIDFKDFANPVVKKVDFDFSASGFSLVIVNTGGNHADLNEDYAALAQEMKAVARALGGQVLREFSVEKVMQNLSFIRTRVNDRALLRAFHFYADDERVVKQVGALEAKDFDRFLHLVIESGYSSWMLNQNISLSKDFEHQELAVALAVSEKILRGQGAWRVHGGGFAGTIQAFVPDTLLEKYSSELNQVFGPGACHQLIIRPEGAIHIQFV